MRFLKHGWAVLLSHSALKSGIYGRKPPNNRARKRGVHALLTKRLDRFTLPCDSPPSADSCRLSQINSGRRRVIAMRRINLKVVTP